MAALIARWETTKKDKHGKDCHNHRHFFAVCSLGRSNVREGSPGRTLAIESSHGSETGEPLLQIRGWVNGRIKIAVKRSYSRMIRGARPPSPLRERELDWDLESGIGLEG